MLESMNIIGHYKIRDFFDKVIENGNLSHAYCFVGPKQVGKRALAEQISAKILGVPVEKLKTQPDFTVLEQELNEKTGKTKKNIDIDQIRNLRSTLFRRSFLGGYKIAIIDQAEKMNISSANALLKTLEEPKEKTVLFLVTNNEKMLPVTIRSRAQMIYFHRVKTEVIENELKKREGKKNNIVINGDRTISDKLLNEIARLCTGLPGRAICWVEDQEAYKAHKKEIVRFVNLPNKSFHDKLKLVEELFGDKSDYVVARERLQTVLDLWSLLLRDWVLMESLNEDARIHKVPFKKKIEPSRMLKLSQKISEAKILLNKNVHPRLLVEDILLEIH
jgi:DNA polymerase III subunit delta'